MNNKKIQLKVVPLEERILLDAAVAAVVANAVVSAAHGGQAVALTADTSAAVPSSNAPIIYVDVNAKGSVRDGKSWNTAYTSLEDALNKASQTASGDQIWIAQGTYRPTQIYDPNGVIGGASGLNDPHLKTFDIPTNTTLIGGFKSGMKSISQANPLLNQTILSGDLLGNDVNNPSAANYLQSKADNAWHVVTVGNDITGVGSTVALKNLSIINGYAVGPSGTPDFTPFIYNHNFGGGLYAFNSNVTMNNDLVQYNYSSGDGGGVFTNNTNITVLNSSFLNNRSVTRGGAIEVFNTFEGDTPHYSNIINSYFKDNSVLVFGGAIVGEGTFPNLSSAMNIVGSTFVNNTAPEGGAITIDSLTTNIQDSTFIGNIATVNGGAVATTNIVDTIVGGPNQFVTTVSDSLFYNNIAKGDAAAHAALNSFIGGTPIGINFALGGGALTSYITGQMVVKDSVFVGNIAENGAGGAILNGNSSADHVFGYLTEDEASTIISGSTFIGNKALNGSGGAIASVTDHILPDNRAERNLTVKNSYFLGNTASQNGGAIASDASTVVDKGNIFVGNQAHLGDQLYASNSTLNGISSSAPKAFSNQVLNNIFLLLDSDDLYLA